MKEIKFRAWNTRRKEMEIIDDLYWFEENMCHHNGDNDYIIQQYTGLTDNKGRSVYEGDIVRSGLSTAIVEWDDDIDQDFYWGNASGFVFNFDPSTMSQNGDYEVIGNIFEGVDK